MIKQSFNQNLNNTLLLSIIVVVIHRQECKFLNKRSASSAFVLCLNNSLQCVCFPALIVLGLILPTLQCGCTEPACIEPTCTNHVFSCTKDFSRIEERRDNNKKYDKTQFYG